MRIDLDKDVLGWRPEKGEVDDLGYDIPDRIYNQLDFDRDITFPGRTKMGFHRPSQRIAGRSTDAPVGRTGVSALPCRHVQ